jgi:lysylphosphatidylglycerol synthetase-like protein (DUF2156 family)
MQRWLLHSLNIAYLVLMLVGLPAAASAHWFDWRITVTRQLYLVLIVASSLGAALNGFAAFFLAQGKRNRRLCLQWCAAHATLLLLHAAVHQGYIHFDWLKRFLLHLQSLLD